MHFDVVYIALLDIAWSLCVDFAVDLLPPKLDNDIQEINMHGTLRECLLIAAFDEHIVMH